MSDWPRASAWLAGADAGAATSPPPWSSPACRSPRWRSRRPGTSTGRPRFGPGWHKLSTWHGERRISLEDVPVHDLGDALEPPPLTAPLTVLLGGHNGVTWHALRTADLGRWGLLTLDAHHDVRPYEPGAVGNGSPVRALIDAGLPGHQRRPGRHPRLLQLPRPSGVVRGAGRTRPRSRRDRRRRPSLLDELAARCDAIYVDIDLDVLDRAFAPACPGSRPGGISPRQLLDAAFVAGAHPQVRCVDIVELDPLADVAHVTTDAAALTLLNVAAGYASRPL